MKPGSPLQNLGRPLLVIAAFVALLIARPERLPAQRSIPMPAPLRDTPRAAGGDSLRIYLMTMGQGEEVYELFGHNAIWVHDPSRAIDTVYNWGVFDMRAPHFIMRFLRGKMEYSMDGDPLDATIAFYRMLNRSVRAQELDLTPAEKKSLVDYLHWNERPENADYRYNYYLDNCSTRVRDALDRATGGQIRPQLKAIKTDETYRSHSLRLMQGMRAMVSGVDLLLGRPTDVKLSADEAAFLPMQLMNHLRSVTLDGGKRRLFKDDFVVLTATRPPEPDRVPRLWLWFTPISIGLVVLVLWLSGATGAGRRRAAAFVVAFLSAMIGILGTIITGLITLTDHVAAHANENFFLLNPIWLGVAVLAPMILLRPRFRPGARRLTWVALALASVSILMHVVGLSRQSNWDAIILILPVELAIGWTLFAASHSPSVAGSAG